MAPWSSAIPLKEGFHGATSVVVAKEEFDGSLLVNFHILCFFHIQVTIEFLSGLVGFNLFFGLMILYGP
jgi:hypothetical protein